MQEFLQEDFADMLSGEDWMCGRVECDAPAVAAMVFRNLDGHAHVCPEHREEYRMHSPVAFDLPLPCPLPHGTMWIGHAPLR